MQLRVIRLSLYKKRQQSLVQKDIRDMFRQPTTARAHSSVAQIDLPDLS